MKRKLIISGIAITYALLCLVMFVAARLTSDNTAVARAEYVASLPAVPLPKGPPPKGKNLILIVVDTLRADRLGCYGFQDKPTSPNIDKLATEGFVFDNFFGASPWTTPSLATILTGVSPAVHNTGLPLPKVKPGTKKIDEWNLYPINSSISTLAELLQPKMTTAGVANNIFLNPVLGFKRGFKHYDYRSADIKRYRKAHVVTNNGLAWIRRNRKTPFFIMLHYFDPHLPYSPPKRYHKEFIPSDSDGLTLPFVAKPNPKGPVPSETKQAFIKGAYNGEVRFVDNEIGRLINGLRRMKILEESWIVFTSDHGEEHYEHGGFEHGHRYEDEVMRLPLIIRAPGRKWGAMRRVPYASSHVDLMPTMLQLFRVPIPKHIEGRSLVPMMRGKKNAHHPVYMEYNLYGDEQFQAYFDGRYKLIRSENKKKGFMYDLEEDPGELTQLEKDHPKYAEVEKKLDTYLSRRLKRIAKAKKNDTSGTVTLPEHLEKSLRGLGYIK